ncbi:MAG: hypothetical protein DHS20C15_34390 [Planctomycetota bacterium]|nr:MAG: hypothetical protein DHS20C15_34390 [Planctomycetota bacterium]
MDKLLGKAPLFPLPEGALLPGELLPLHIFEPRYRLMMDAVRKGDRMLAIATLAPGWEADYHGRPTVEPIVGVGRVVKDRENPDGTSDIVLQGLMRGRITRELDGKAYRQAVVQLCQPPEEHPAVAFRRRRALLEGLACRLGPKGMRCDVTAEIDTSLLSDRIASALELSPRQRVSMLQAVEADGRVKLLLQLLDDTQHGARLLSIIPALSDFSLSLSEGQDRAP